MNPSFTRPVPRWLRVWSILTVIVVAAVIVLGSLITTFKVGMSDPVWPTEPWFLIVNNHVWVEEPARGFLIEHTHRLVAWAIGVFATVLAVGAWVAEPDRKTRWTGWTGRRCRERDSPRIPTLRRHRLFLSHGRALCPALSNGATRTR